MNRITVSTLLVFLVVFGCCGCTTPGAVKVTGKTEVIDRQAPQPKGMPSAILVADFEIDSADIKSNEGILGGDRPLRPGLLRGQGGLLHRRDDPADKARTLVDLLSDTLVQKLADKGLPARRLAPGESAPAGGWLVQGQFYEVDEGNRLRRAVIGFGAGETDMQLGVSVTDCAVNPPETFMTLGTQAGSGKMPGAIVTMNPYVAAAKFVMAKNASEKDVKHTAGKIADEIVNYMKSQGMLKQ